jgi:hypothetical protein
MVTAAWWAASSQSWPGTAEVVLPSGHAMVMAGRGDAMGRSWALGGI